jgi:uncharacterized protein YbaP (TraB family)
MAISKGDRNLLSYISVATLVLCARVAGADPLPLWEIESGGNRLLIMGSVHFLRSGDYPLPAEIEAAYENANRLVMEIDMDDLDPAKAQAMMTDMGVSKTGSLSQVIGEESYAEAKKLAGPIGIPLNLFDSFEPWFAALSISQLRMIQLGFDPAWGVEAQLTQRAQRDGKGISGLETLEEQLGFMDTLDIDTQRLFLLESLREANEVDEEINTVVRAWKSGDTDTLETMLLDGLAKAPNLYDALLVERNRNWVAKIAELTQSPDDILIVVGAMHLVGDSSVLSMLEERGIGSRQISGD